MIKKTTISILIIGLLIVITIYVFSLFQNVTVNQIADDNTNTTRLIGDSKPFWLTKDDNFQEERIGWIGDRILINQKVAPDSNVNVYVYDPKHGKKELIANQKGNYGKFMGCTEIIPFVMNDKKILLHYDYKENIVLQMQLNDIMLKKNDYSYLRVEDAVPKDDPFRKNIEEYAKKSKERNREAKSMLQVFDLETKKQEKIFEYINKYSSSGIEGQFPISSFQSVGYSNNSRYIVWCVENEPGNYVFSIYDTIEKSTRVHKTIEIEGRFNFLNNVSVSNDGNTIWFIGKPRKNYLSGIHSRGNNIFKIDMSKKDSASQLIAENVTSYKTSFDNKFIVYFKLEKNSKEISGDLCCMNLFNLDEVLIDENIFLCYPNGFDLSDSDNRFTYLKNNDKGVEILAGELKDKNIRCKHICDLPGVLHAQCVDLGSDDKLLVGCSSKEKEETIYNTCVVDIRQGFFEMP